MKILNWKQIGAPVPKGEPWPDTKEYYIKRALMAQELIDDMRKEIERLKLKVNQLRQRDGRNC